MPWPSYFHWQIGAEDAGLGWKSDFSAPNPNPPPSCLLVCRLGVCKWIPSPGPAHTAQPPGSFSGPVLPAVVPKPLCSPALPSRGPESAQKPPTGNCRPHGLLGFRTIQPSHGCWESPPLKLQAFAQDRRHLPKCGLRGFSLRAEMG